MNEDVFGDIASIDAALDKEFGELANNQIEDEEQEANNEDVVDTSEGETTQEETAENTADTVEEPAEQSSEETEKVNKKDYAFANLRTENGNLKKERDAYKSDSDYLKSLAQSYGYDNVSEFQEALKQQRYQREAESKGYDYDLYKKTMEQEERIARLEKEKVE